MKTNASQPASLKFGALVFNEHITQAEQELLRANATLMKEVVYFESAGKKNGGTGYDVVINHDGESVYKQGKLIDVYVCRQDLIPNFQQIYSIGREETLSWKMPGPEVTKLESVLLDVNSDFVKDMVADIAKHVTDFHQKLDDMFKTLQAFGYVKKPKATTEEPKAK